MPQIPVYNSPQVERAAVPGAKQSVGGMNAVAFGASNTFKGAEDLASTYIESQQKEGERAAAEEALRATSEYQREYIGKQNELRQRQGKNAEGVDKEADAWMAETAGKYIKNLKDPRAVQLFDQKAMQLRNNMLDWSTGHVTQQREVALDVELTAAKQVSIDTAINDSRPQIVNQSIADIQQKNAFTAHRKGYDDVWIQAQNSMDIEKLHGAILQNAMDQDSVGGVSGYLQAHGDSIDAGMKAKAEKWIHNKTIDETAGAYADSLMAGGVGYLDALEGARKKFSGDDEDKYVSKIKERYGEMEHAKRQAADEIKDSVYKSLASGGDIAKVQDETVQKLVSVDPEAGYRLQKQISDAKEVNALGGAFAKETNPYAMMEVDSRIVNGDFTDPSQLKVYRGQLAESDYKAAQKTIENRKVLKDVNADQIYNEFVPKQKNHVETQDEMARRAQFFKDAADYVKETSRPQDIKAFAANWFLKGEVDSGHWYQSDKTMSLGEAVATGQSDKFKPIDLLKDNALTHDYIERDKLLKERAATVIKTGTLNGKKVIQYGDGSIKYAE
jgi:hypothetical protein